MSHIISTGFNAASTDGELESLESDLKRLAGLGVETVELTPTSMDLIAGGRIIKERVDRLAKLTAAYPFNYTMHGLVSSNFMDPDTLRYQLEAAKALVELCDRVGSRILVHHGGCLRADQIFERGEADRPEREALHEPAEFAKPYGVRIALENIFTTEPGQYRQTPVEVAQTVKAVGHPNLVALIDFSHAFLEATYRGLDFREQLRAMARWLAISASMIPSAARLLSKKGSIRRNSRRSASATYTCRSAGVISTGTTSSPSSPSCPARC